jgi:hypothetical protein
MVSNKKVVNYKIHNFKDLQLLFWLFLYLRFFAKKIKFSNLRDSNVLFIDKSNSNKKVLGTYLVQTNLSMQTMETSI